MQNRNKKCSLNKIQSNIIQLKQNNKQSPQFLGPIYKRIVFFDKKKKNKFLNIKNFQKITNKQCSEHFVKHTMRYLSLVNCLIYFQKIQKEQFNRILILMKEKSKGSQYKCAQVFGYKGNNQKIHEEDIISVLKFSHDGNHLALGDKAGRIIIFKAGDMKKKQERLCYYTEFQAYNRQFDPLNSNDIDEEVIGLSWMKQQGQYQKMLTMNSRIIKLWKIYEKPEKKIIRSASKQLSLPKFQVIQNNVNAAIQKTFPNKHEEDLLGLDLTNNQQYILGADTVKTILWNIQKSKTPYLVADLQSQKKIQTIKENINCLKAHPTSDSLFLYGTNRGSIVLSDTRNSGNRSTKLKLETQKDKSNFFTQMISSYSSLDFLKGQKQIIARDYLSVKVWDLCKTDKPVLSITIQQALKSKLCDIFENDCIYDKFSISVSKDSNTILTGNYNNCFHAIDINDSSNTQYEINYKKQTISKPMIPGKSNSSLSKMDYSRKIIAGDFHPTTNLLAAASLNCFLIYSM